MLETRRIMHTISLLSLSFPFFSPALSHCYRSCFPCFFHTVSFISLSFSTLAPHLTTSTQLQYHPVAVPAGARAGAGGAEAADFLSELVTCFLLATDCW